MASSSSTPSSSITLPKRYQVFLSFRGEDTRVGFTGHLDYALRGKQIATFIDYKLERGDEISPALLKSIQESKIAVVIFSKDYASSKWCLRELAEIVKCKKLNELLVLPIFYYVDPSDVRKQTGPFKDSFAKHENESQDEVKEWREAFTEASKLAGWPYDGTRPEFELVHDIVEDVQRKLMSEIENISLPLNDFEGLMPLIGIDKRIEQVMPLLCLDTMDVRIIGFWGMGGIGKTTLAKSVFNRISCQFDGACFIEKVGERLENRESDRLLLDVLSEVLHENLKLETLSSTIPPFIKERFNRAKVFIVLDDVINFMKLETLVKGLIRCGLGSRIIITSRDKQVLDNFKVLDCNIYKVEGLNFDEALMLFSNYAFSQNHPTEDFMYLSVRMVCYAKGNPLALKVLGSCLLGMSKQEWESAFDDLQGIGGSEISNVLKLSYDRLNDKEKELFLDIACFFYTDVEHYAELLDCKYSLRVLSNKSLITKEYGIIRMHGLLRQMGRDIVSRESPKIPGKRSRLWKPDDVIWTLKNNNGAEEVEGISLRMDKLKDGHLDLSCRVFDKMTNLRLLIFTYCFEPDEDDDLESNEVHLSDDDHESNEDDDLESNEDEDLESKEVHLSDDDHESNEDDDLESNEVHLSDGRLNSLPDDLIILEWHKYPLRALPSDFNPKKLVKLDLSNSNIEQLWEGTKHAPKLKWLILSYCTYLIRIPNLSDFLSLEHIDLSGCKSLAEFPSSVQQLTKLQHLSLGGCSNVTKFPRTSTSIETLILSYTAIVDVPSSIQSLTNLTKLDLTGCKRLKHISASIFKLKSVHSLSIDNCSELETFPETSKKKEILNSLELSGTAELSSSIEHLTGLRRLTLSECTNLKMLPSRICDLTSLEELNLSNCTKLDKLPEKLGNLKSLKHLIVKGSAVGQLPSSIRYLENLEFLDCSECKGLTKLPPLAGLRSLSVLFLEGCNLMEIPEDIGCLSSLECLDLHGNKFKSLPKSIKHLSKLESLLLSDCNMLGSLTELPVALQKLEAINCKQLCQALPDASEFKRFITSKCYISRFPCGEHRKQRCQLCPPGYGEVKFLFVNCFKLDQKAVSNVFEESLKGLEEPRTRFSICLPGTEIPDWFTYKNSGSSINIRVLRHDLVNRKFMGFAICAVLRKKYSSASSTFAVSTRFGYHIFPLVDIYCHIETGDDHKEFFCASLDFVAGEELPINSDHILLGYCEFPEFLYSFQKLEMLPDSESDLVDRRSKIDYKSRNFEVKYCAAHPIYAKPIEDIWETSGRSGRSDDNEEKVEPHSKRFCTQPKFMLPISNQNP